MTRLADKIKFSTTVLIYIYGLHRGEDDIYEPTIVGKEKNFRIFSKK